MSNLRIESGHHLIDSAIRLESDIVRFFAEDGRCMFEVRVLDKTTIEIRGCESAIIDGVLRSTALVLMPVVSNCVHVTTAVYPGAK